MALPFRHVATKLPSRTPYVKHAICGSRPLPFSTSQTTCNGNDNATSMPENRLNLNNESPKGPQGIQEPPKKAKKKTMAELDEELKLKMEGMSGGGGSAGVEYENGKAEGLRRGVKDNMFRVI